MPDGEVRQLRARVAQLEADLEIAEREAEESIWKAEEAFEARDKALALVAGLEAYKVATTSVLMDRVSRAVHAEIALRELAEAARDVAAMIDGSYGTPAWVTRVQRLREALAEQGAAPQETGDAEPPGDEIDRLIARSSLAGTPPLTGDKAALVAETRRRLDETDPD